MHVAMLLLNYSDKSLNGDTENFGFLIWLGSSIPKKLSLNLVFQRN